MPFISSSGVVRGAGITHYIQTLKPYEKVLVITRYLLPVLLPEATAVHGEATRSQPLREHPLHGTGPHRLARMHAAGIDTATGIGVVPQERVAYRRLHT